MAVAVKEPALESVPEQVTIRITSKEAEHLYWSLDWTDHPGLVDLQMQLGNLGYGHGRV